MGLGIYRFGEKFLSNKMRLGLLALAVILVLAGGFIISAKNVVLVVDGRNFNVRVHRRTVQDALDSMGIELEQGDAVRPEKDSRIYDGSVVVVARKKRVAIFDGNTKKVVAMTMPSMAEILCAQGITLGKDDLVETDLQPEDDQMPSIRITRRTIEVITERKEVAYSVERIADKSLEPFESRVVQKGVTGMIENKIRVVTINAKETQRTIVETRNLRSPRKEIVKYAPGIGSRGSAYRPVKELVMRVTAYTHTGNRTATGTWPATGTIAVDPSVIPLGTPLYVEGYGFGIARDTGGSIKGSRLDVFFETKKNALKWGKRTVQVRILRKVN